MPAGNLRPPLRRSLGVSTLVLALAGPLGVTSSGASTDAGASPADCSSVVSPAARGPRLSWGMACTWAAGGRRPGSTASGEHGATGLSQAPPSQAYGSVWDNLNGHKWPGLGFDYAADMAVSPDGNRVFITGYSWAGPAEMDFTYATVAFDDRGRSLWVAKFDGAFARFDAAAAIAVSPTGDRVFVTGVRDFRITGPDGYAGNIETIAYDAETGAEVWSATYDGPGEGDMLDSGRDMAVSPDGQHVYVTGQSQVTPTAGAAYESKIITISYRTDDGSLAWTAESGDSGNHNRPEVLVVDPGGRYVYVVGKQGGQVVTRAYRADGGSTAWETIDPAGNANLVGGPMSAFIEAVAAPDGDHLYVLGGSDSGWVISEYGSQSGEARPLSTYQADMPERLARQTGLAISPDGTRLFATGYVVVSRSGLALGGEDDNLDQKTVAYDSSSGAQLWESSLDAARFVEYPTSVAVSPDGTEVYVSGRAGEGVEGGGVLAGQYIWGWDGQPAVIRSGNGWAASLAAYDAATGQERWVSIFSIATTIGQQVIPSPTGERLFMQGALLSDADHLLLVAERSSLGATNGVSVPLEGNTMDYLLISYAI